MTALELSTVLELRREAAELIERLGWVQGNWVSRRGEVCLEEALNRVCRYQPLDLVGALKDGLGRELDSWDLTQWNDAEGRTQAEVLAALRGTS